MSGCGRHGLEGVIRWVPFDSAGKRWPGHSRVMIRVAEDCSPSLAPTGANNAVVR